MKIGMRDLYEEETERGDGLTEADLPPMAVLYGLVTVDRESTLY